jgi:adenine deaminase
VNDAQNALDEFIVGIPKAELHIHIEGALEPEMAFALAKRHGAQLSHKSVAELREAYRFANLQEFLDIYYAGADVLRGEEDFRALTRAYLERARADGVTHAEIFFDPQTHTARGVPFATVIRGIAAGLAEGERELRISSRLILCFLRHLSEDDAMRTLDEALAFKHLFSGVGLDSSERGHPPSKFTRVFLKARIHGLHAVAHAGEEGPAEYITQALDELGAERIDHGVRCEGDSALCERLAREAIPLTVCPLSNVKLKVFPRMEDHNLKRLLDQGLRVTVNSDDPAYFGGYIAANYRAAQRALGLDRADIARLARNSFEASFLPAAEKRAWAAQVDAFAARHAG